MPTKRENLLMKIENDNSVPDPDIISDKNEKYEPVTADSGFISGGNLVLTEEIKVAAETDNSADLTERFSNLNVECRDENDLSYGGQKPAPQPPVDTGPQEQDNLWKEYFQQDEDGDTFLHLAIIQGFVEVVLALVRMAPHPWLLDISNDDGQTPIHLAASIGHWRIVRWLIIAGAKPCPRNIRGDSPLHIAAKNGNLMCCKAIIDPVRQHEREALTLTYPQQPSYRINLDQWNYEGQTCVHVAAIEGHVNVLRHLVCYGADINAREGRQGYTALHYAIERGDESLAQFLLFECKKLDVEAITYGGSNVLQLGYSVSSNIAEELRLRGVPGIPSVCF